MTLTNDYMIDQLKVMSGGGFFYMACPYSKGDYSIEENLRLSMQMCGELMQLGLFIHHPTYMTHDIAGKYSLPTDHVHWWRYNEAFMKAAAGIIVAQIHPSWNKSRGVMAEIDWALMNGKQVFYARMTPAQSVKPLLLTISTEP